MTRTRMLSGTSAHDVRAMATGGRSVRYAYADELSLLSRFQLLKNFACGGVCPGKTCGAATASRIYRQPRFLSGRCLYWHKRNPSTLNPARHCAWRSNPMLPSSRRRLHTLALRGPRRRRMRTPRAATLGFVIASGGVVPIALLQADFERGSPARCSTKWRGGTWWHGDHSAQSAVRMAGEVPPDGEDQSKLGGGPRLREHPAICAEWVRSAQAIGAGRRWCAHRSASL